jgi:hypothetical protein
MIIDIPNVGQVEFPDSMTEEEINAAARRLYQESQPKEGTTPVRAAQMLTRGMAAPVAGAALGGAVGGPVGALAGSLAVPAADIVAGGMRAAGMDVGYPSELVQQALTRLGMPAPETPMERAIVSGGGALGGVGGQVGALSQLARTATTPVGRGVAQTLAQQPGRQLAAAAPAGAVAQAVGEETESPLAGMAAGAATALPFGLGARGPRIPQEEVKAQATGLYDELRSTGFKIVDRSFRANMQNIAGKLRNEGYTPTGFPKIEGALKELTTNRQAKTFDELQALRNIITSAQASNDAAERRLAGILKDEFDTYISNIPTRDVRDAQGRFLKDRGQLDLWEQARGTYSRLKKSEVFSEMLENAQLDQSKFTQSGAENSLASQLRQLAKNKNKMRLFTQDERDAIKEAAKGGTTQNLLKFFGRFAPTGPVSGIFTGGATVASPMVGIGLAAGTTAARMGASAMRRRSVEDLMQQMLAGRPVRQPSVAATMATRGAVSAPPLGLLFPYEE